MAVVLKEPRLLDVGRNNMAVSQYLPQETIGGGQSRICPFDPGSTRVLFLSQRIKPTEKAAAATLRLSDLEERHEDMKLSTHTLRPVRLQFDHIKER